MTPELNRGRPWQIDQILDRLRGEYVRVAAQSFAPGRWKAEIPRRLISARELILPDNSSAAGLPLFLEGQLQQFIRQVGVVYVHLGPPASSEESIEGMVYFRGKTAVILRGPAIVKLAYPFHVEKVPLDGCNYWRDLQLSRVQFKLPL